MANNDSLSQTAKLLYDVESKNAEASISRLINLSTQLENVSGKAAGAAKKAAEAFALEGSDQNLVKLQGAMSKLRQSLSDVRTAGGNVNLVSENEVTKVIALSAEMSKLDKAIREMAKNRAIGGGTLGLDSGDIKDKLNALKALEAAQVRANLAIEQAKKNTNDDGAKGLAQYVARAKAIEENIRLIKLQTVALQEAAAAQKGQTLNETGQRQVDYNKVKDAERKANQERNQILQEYLRQKDAAIKTQDKNEEGYRQEQYKKIQAQERGNLFQLLEERKEYLRQKQLIENQQAKEFLGFNPATALKESFGSTNALGADKFAKVNLLGTGSPEQIAAQKTLLDLQTQLVERMRQKLPLDAAHNDLVTRAVTAAQQLNTLTVQNNQHLLEQEAAHRRIALASGLGAASLLAIQASIRANGLILNGVQNALSQALRSAIGLEAEFKNVQAVTATTNTEMQQLEETIKNTAASTKFSSTEVASAALIMGQAGLSAKETAEALPAVALLAVAAGTSLAQAVSLSTSVLGIFDKQASETVDIANKITQAANGSKVSVEKLAIGFQYAGNIAHLTGISFEETTAAMAAMSNAGILNGSTLGSGLRSFLTEVQKPSEEFLHALARIGLGLSDVDFRAHGLLGVVNTLRQAGFVATDAIKSFDIRGAAAFNALVANPDDLERQYKNLLDTHAALNANAVQMDSLQAQGKRLQTSMENLAATGFAPLGQLLKDIAGGLATFIQWSSQATVVVGTLGTALAALSVVATARFAVSITAGSLALLGFEAATISSFRAITAFNLAPLLGSLYTLGTAALGAVITSFSTLTVTSGGLAVALEGVGAAIAGLSLATGIGIALAVIAAGYYAISYAAGSSKRAIDEATAATNNAKAAFDTKSKTIESLNETISTLTYRQKQLTDGSMELSLATTEVKNKFGENLVILDGTIHSGTELIDVLKKLRTEMEGLATVDLNVAIDKARTLKDLTEKSASGGLKNIDRDGGSRSIEALLQNKDNVTRIKQLGIDPSILSGAGEAIKNQNFKGQGGIDISYLPQILEKVLSDDRIKLDPLWRNALGDLKKNSVGAALEISAANHSSSDLEALTKNASQRQAIQALRNQPNPNGKGTIGDAIIPNSAVYSGVKQDNPSATNIELLNMTKAAVEASQKSNKDLAANLLKADPKNPAVMALVLEINTANEALNKQIQDARKDAAPDKALVDHFATKADNNEHQAAVKRYLQTRDPADAEKIKSINARLINRDFENKTVDESNPKVIALARAQADDAIASKNESDLNIKEHTTPSQVNANNERRAKLAEKSELAGAASDKALANLFDDFDEVDKLFESGKAHIIKAGEFAQQALKARQADEKIKSDKAGDDPVKLKEIFAQESSDLQSTTNQNLQKYVTEFGAFGHAASLRLQQLTFSIKDKKNQLQNLKLDSEDRIFQAGGTLRGLELQKASQVAPTSLDPNGSLDTRISKEKLRLTQMAIEDNYKALAILGDDQSGLIHDQTELLKEVTDKIGPLATKVAELQKKIKEGNLSPEDLTKTEGDLSTARSALSEAQKEKVQRAGDLRDSRGQKQSDQANGAALEVQAANIRVQIPVEFNYESLTKTLENGVNQWREAASNLDSIKTLHDGMAGIFSTSVSSIAGGLKSIVDGTKSVKEGFRSMAQGIIGSILEVAAQLAAQQAVKAIFGALAGSWGGSGGSTGGFGDSVGGDLGSSGFDFSTVAATGGYINSKGNIERMRHFARGGPVTGGVSGRDSVPALLMPNEFVMNTKAVDAVGTDFLHGLNSQTNSVVSSSSSTKPKDAKPTDANVVNVWVVTPDQKPPLGAKDVVAIVSDDLSRGGSIKTLVKSIQMGN